MILRADVKAVVAPEDDDGIGFVWASVQSVEQPTHAGIGKGHASEIRLDHVTPSGHLRLIAANLGIELARRGKRVVLVDDSIVRGTTIRKLIRMLRENGAREVHLRIGSPPIRHSCFYGIDTPEESKLIASGQSVEAVCQSLGADSLRYLSLEGLRGTVSNPRDYCYACFTGEYPAGRKDLGP